MSDNRCRLCDRPMPDQAYACRGCGIVRSTGQLRAIASLAGAARDVAHRQNSRSAGGSSGKPGSSPPIDLDASGRLERIHSDLMIWGRRIADARGLGLHLATTGADPIALVAGWLAGHLEWLRHRPEAANALRDIDAAARRIVAIINGPIPGRYAGPCSALVDERECGRDVTSRPGSSIATCRACGAQYDVDEQQAWMREQIEDHLARPVEIAGVLLRLGFPVGYSTIAAYAAKGRLATRGHDQKGRALFRIGDVLDLRMTAH